MDPEADSSRRSPVDEPGGASWRRQLAFRGFALSVGVAVGLLGMELLARLVLTDFYACDAALGWTFEPGKAGLKIDRRLEYAVPARISSAGFHDVEHTLEKPPGTLRIVLFGDSMLAGMQVALEQSLARRLEARLAESNGGHPRFEVVNCATDGYGTAQAWLMFEQRCRHYRPDLVLLGFFAINDVMDNYSGARSQNHPVARKCGRPYFELQDGQLARAEDPLPALAASPLPRIDRALRRSYLYQIIAPPPAPAGEEPRSRLQDIFLREYAPEQLDAWEVTKRLLLAFDEDVRRSGARFGVLEVPSRFEIDPAHAGSLENADRMDFERPHRLLTAFLAESGLAHLDLATGVGAAAARAGSPPLYFRRDMHWTESGNDVAGEIVARWVAARY